MTNYFDKRWLHYMQYPKTNFIHTLCRVYLATLAFTGIMWVAKILEGGLQ